jgi:catechol 2,3-dioxygenase-like lactoylglutathione lyase family enzyme
MIASTETLVFDHVHFSAPDPDQAVDWYVRHLGARLAATPDRVLIGDRLWMIFNQAEAATPSTGSVIEGIGFSFPDAGAKLRQLEAAGARVIAPVRSLPGALGAYRSGLVEDPLGVRVAIVQDTDTLGFHHVRLRVPEPEAAFMWYLAAFGGERARLKDRIDGLRYGRVWLLAEKGDGAPSVGRAIDHIAWRTTSLDVKVAALRTKGMAFTAEPRQLDERTRISFLEGPSGARIELLQRM